MCRSCSCSCRLLTIFLSFSSTKFHFCEFVAIGRGFRTYRASSAKVVVVIDVVAIIVIFPRTMVVFVFTFIHASS